MKYRRKGGMAEAAFLSNTKNKKEVYTDAINRH